MRHAIKALALLALIAAYNSAPQARGSSGCQSCGDHTWTAFNQPNQVYQICNPDSGGYTSCSGESVTRSYDDIRCANDPTCNQITDNPVMPCVPGPTKCPQEY